MGLLGDLVGGIGHSVNAFFSTIPPFLKFLFFLFILTNLLIPVLSVIFGTFYTCTSDGELYELSAIKYGTNEFTEEEINDKLDYCVTQGYDIEGRSTNITKTFWLFSTARRIINSRLLYDNTQEMCSSIVIGNYAGTMDADTMIRTFGTKIESEDETSVTGLICSTGEEKHVSLGFYGIDVLDAWLWNSMFVLIMLVPFALKWYSQFK